MSLAFGERSRLTHLSTEAAVARWGRGSSPIRSIQRGTIVLPSGGAGVNDTATATITAVDPTNASVRFLGAYGTSASYGNAVRLALTNATTVTASHLRDQTTTVSFDVVEYWPGVVLLQVGTISLATVATFTATITSVDTSKSELWTLGVEGTTATAGNLETYVTALTFTNATTITATRGSAAGTVLIGYAVVTRRS